MKKRNMRKTLKLAVACSLVSTMMLGAPVYAAEPATGNTTTTTSTSLRLSFPDVPVSHWAIKHVTRLAVEGVVQGDDFGRYNPENSVSQQDVIIMAIRMMGFENAALQSKSNVALPFDDVRPDARPYVAYAIDRGLIDLQEEYTAGKKWGTLEAPREWVAQIVIRAIGKTSEATSRSDVPTGFADNSKISSSALGFVNAALSLGIVQGFEDNTFRPEGSVTRAQMATFWSRAEQYLANPSSRIVKGTIMSLDGNRMTVRSSDGKMVTLTMHSSAVYYTAENDTERLASSDIKQYNEVYVLQNQNTAYFVELLNDEVPMRSIEGKLVSVNMNDLTLAVEIEGKFYTYDLASNVRVKDLNGDGLSLGSLLENSIIEMRKHAEIAEAKVEEITVKKAPVNKTVAGAFQSFDAAALTVVIKASDTGLLETYPVSGASVFVQDEKPFDPTLLFPGDVVRVVVKNDNVSAVEVVKQLVEKREQGKFLSISEDKSIVTIQKGDDQYAAYRVSDKLLVVLGENQFGAIGDLMPGDELHLEINQNRIDKITVGSRTIENLTLATIEQFNEDSKYLLVKDEQSRLKVYTITDATALKYDENTLPFESFKTYLAKGKRVNIIASQDKLMSVQIATRMEGTVVSVSASNGDITIRTASGVLQTYRTAGTVVVNRYSQPLGRLADLRAGDYVRGYFDGTQETVVGLHVRETQIVQTTSVDTAANRIQVIDSKGETKQHSLFALPVHHNGAAVGVGSILVDEPLRMVFVGGTLESIQVADAYRGKVVSVDATAGKITITDFSNNNQVLDVGTNVIVTNGTTTLPSLASLNQDDRVQVVLNTSGAATVQVIPAAQRTFQLYDPNTQQMVFMRPTISDKTHYPIHAKAYLHRGTEVLSPTSFTAGELLTVYFLNGKVLEIVKP